MWLHKQTIKDYVALSFKPQCLAYAHIRKTGSSVPYTMNSYKIIPFSNLELERQIIFNPTYIGKELCSLIGPRNVCDREIRFSLAGPTIFEAITASDTIDPTYETQLKNMVWQEMPLYTHDGCSLNYLCGISRELLFQYQLLAINQKFNISCITTSSMALLYSAHELAPGIHNKQYSCINDIISLIPTESLHTVCSHIPSTENPLLMAELIGLCIAELTYENN
jgi:hypothetical protein